jgi:hypothetical protein
MKQRLKKELAELLAERLSSDWEEELVRVIRPFEIRPDEDGIVRRRYCLAICLPEFKPAPHIGSLLAHIDKEKHVLWNVKQRKAGDEKAKWRTYIRVRKVRFGVKIKSSRFNVKPPKHTRRVKDFSRS